MELYWIRWIFILFVCGIYTRKWRACIIEVLAFAVVKKKSESFLIGKAETTEHTLITSSLLFIYSSDISDP